MLSPPLCLAGSKAYKITHNKISNKELVQLLYTKCHSSNQTVFSATHLLYKYVRYVWDRIQFLRSVSPRTITIPCKYTYPTLNQNTNMLAVENLITKISSENFA